MSFSNTTLSFTNHAYSPVNEWHMWKRIHILPFNGTPVDDTDSQIRENKRALPSDIDVLESEKRFRVSSPPS